MKEVPKHNHPDKDNPTNLLKYFTRDPIFLVKVNQTAPSILKYIFDFQNHVNWFILSQRTKGKVDDILNYKDACKGQRCFIVGNGPSVNKTDFNLIKNEILFGTNRLYQGMKQLGINCTYYVTSNRTIVRGDFDGLSTLDMPIFLGQHGAEEYSRKRIETKQEFKQKPIVFRYKRRLMWNRQEMSTDLTKGAADGDTVVIECLQIAYYMGFTKVYLLGCDCDFSVQGHFYNESPDSYHDEMMTCISRWIESYKMCKKAYEADGREIINATVGGKLEVFKRQSLDEIMKTKKINNKKPYGTTHEN